MTLHSRIEGDYIAAYKAKEQVKVAVLRMVKTAAKNRQVELGRELTDEELLDVLAKQGKQRQESIEQFKQAGRDDLVDKEVAEFEVLKEYLPQALSPEETSAAVEKAIADTGAAGMQDMGKVMAAVMAAHKGAIDGKAVSALVRQKLSA